MAGTNATGADLDTSNGTVPDRFYFLKVSMPSSGRFIVGVTDVISEGGAFAAYFAFFRHF
jgi:hypothetical protein